MQGFGTTGISKFKDKGDNTKMALRTIRTEGDSVLAVQGQPEGPGLSGKAPPQGGAGSRSGIPHRGDGTGRFPEPCGDHAPHRADTSDPSAVCLPEAPALRRRQIWQPVQGGHCPAERRAAVRPPGDGGEDGVSIGETAQSAVGLKPLSHLR